MIENLRLLLLQSDIIKNYVSQENIDGAIFHEFKPKVDINNYIIMKDKPLNLGQVEVYQVDVLIFGKNLNNLLEVEKAVRKQLNDKNGTRLVLNNNVPIKDMTMLIGGGRTYDNDLDRFISVQYFQISI